MDEIMKEYANDVKRFCMSLCHDEQMAEELTQETFYRAYRTIHHYDGTCLMTTWLFQIAKRAWIDALRKKKPITSIDEIKEKELQERQTPETLFHQKYLKEYLMKVISEIDEPEKSVFLLRVVSEKSFKEIGAKFEKSENWARVTYYRTKVKLRERMRQDEDAL